MAHKQQFLFFSIPENVSPKVKNTASMHYNSIILDLPCKLALGNSLSSLVALCCKNTRIDWSCFVIICRNNSSYAKSSATHTFEPVLPHILCTISSFCECNHLLIHVLMFCILLWLSSLNTFSVEYFFDEGRHVLVLS